MTRNEDQVKYDRSEDDFDAFMRQMIGPTCRGMAKLLEGMVEAGVPRALAKLMRATINALVEEGFNEDEAFELTGAWMRDILKKQGKNQE